MFFKLSGNEENFFELHNQEKHRQRMQQIDRIMANDPVEMARIAAVRRPFSVSKSPRKRPAKAVLAI